MAASCPSQSHKAGGSYHASGLTWTSRMPFNMFKAFSSGSRNRTHRGDPTIYSDYPQGYPAADFQPEPVIRSQPQVLRRSSTKRREPIFTPLPSRTPSDTDEYNEGYIRVDSPDAVMRGALNARPGKMDSVLPPLGAPMEGPLSESFSEREHREHAGRLHDVPRLLDRPPQMQRTGSFHSGHVDRLNPDEPIVMNHSQGGSSPASDDTIDAFRAPISVHPSERVIPPLPHNYAGGYPPGARSPTDIYGSHPYEIGRNGYSHHVSEIYNDRYGRASGYGRDGPVYYVVPGGMNVIFQDEHGKEITRVGDFSGRSRPARPGPYVVQDEHGRELYRYDGQDRGTHLRGYSDPPIVRVDAYSSSSQLIHDGNYSSRHRPDPYRRGHDYYPDHREYRDRREKDWRDHRDRRYRGYDDCSRYNEYSEHRGYRDPGTHKDYGSYRDRSGHRDRGGYSEYGGHRDRGQREYGGYGDHDGYRDRGQREHGGYADHVRHREHDEYGEHGYGEHGEYDIQVRPPSRVSSRASHRTHTSRVSMPGGPQQYKSSIPDERRSGRDYAPSHTSMPHPQDEVDISGGLQALHI